MQGIWFQEVDQFEKSKVSQSVHEFLLTLCTSHKYGVIFRDKTLGLSNKHQNPLMYTVLGSLDRPWEHSFAGELIVKIVGACPDLARNVWSEVKPYLEPRMTEKWQNVVKFAGRVLEELQPSCVEYCARELSASQVFIVFFLFVCLNAKRFCFNRRDGDFSKKKHIRSVTVEIKTTKKLVIFWKKCK